MSKSKIASMYIGICSVALAVSARADAAEADLLFYNGRVLTVDANFSVKSAVAVKDGKIIAVGGKELRAAYHAKTEIDLAGRTLMPGFIDTHLHPQSRSKRDIDLANAHSIADLQQMLRAKAQELGKAEWITGFGWQEAQFKENRKSTSRTWMSRRRTIR